MTNVYQAPKAELSENSNSSDLGSIEKGIAGEYNLDIGNVLSEAWRRTKGAKLTMNIALSIYTFIILIGISFAFIPLFIEVSSGSNPEASFSSSIIIGYAIYFVVILLAIPMIAGLFIMGIKRATDQDISVGLMFRYYRKLIPMLLLVIVSGIFIEIGFLFLLIPGIYLSIAYCLATPLIADKNLSFWSAMETSRKAVTQKWFTVFGIIFLILIINIIASIPLGIGLIWSMPMSFIAMGIIYRNMFGVESTSV